MANGNGSNIRGLGQGSDRPLHDRALLLHGRKRNEVLTLREVQQYGTDSFSDPNFYGCWRSNSFSTFAGYTAQAADCAAHNSGRTPGSAA